MFVVEHIAKIKSNAVTIAPIYSSSRKKTNAELKNLEKGKNGDYNGYMSPTTRRKVKEVLETWLESFNIEKRRRRWKDIITRKIEPAENDYLPVLITLDLPTDQLHDDNYLKRHLLNYFITQIRRRHAVKNFFFIIIS